MRPPWFVATCVVLLGAILLPDLSIRAQQSKPTFRSRVTLVPVDVRVLDADGRPVTGLTRDDFIVTEDGVRQEVLQFSFTQLEPAAVPDDPLALRRATGSALAAPTHRTFLFVLGRGRQVGPGKDVRAAIDFIRTRLLPQDRVAVLAYNRTTPFTTDHAAAAATLQSYWDRHELIEARLDHYFSGLAIAYADPDIPPKIQTLVDGIFRQPGVLRARHVTPGDVVDRDAYQDEIAWHADFERDRDADSVLGDLQRNSPTLRDIENLYAGISYMQFFEGEKHLVFLTPHGLDVGSLDRMTTIASLASDARVAVNIVHTYGMVGAPPPDRFGSYPVPSASAIFAQRARVGNSRHLSDLTGGETSAFRYGSASFARLDRSTRAQYLLGYAPAGVWNGKYRSIKIRVNRPNVRVLHRHGYYAREQLIPLDRRSFMTYSRITAAANYQRPIRDIALTIGDLVVSDTADGQALTAQGRIAPGSITFERDGTFYTASLDVLFVAASQRERNIGEIWQTLDFRLSPAEYQRYLEEGVTFGIRVSARGTPAHLKVVVYDYAADAIGAEGKDVTRR